MDFLLGPRKVAAVERWLSMEVPLYLYHAIESKSQSEYGKAVVNSTVLHPTFPSRAELILLATVFFMAWKGSLVYTEKIQVTREILKTGNFNCHIINY